MDIMAISEQNPVFVPFIVAFVLLFILTSPRLRNRRRKRRIKQLARSSEEMTPKQFFAMRNQKVKGERKTAASFDFDGVYLIRNKTKNMYYVGQSVNVLNRLNQHFTGHGNGDVYADYKNGDKFVIRAIALKGSGFKTLDDLERYAIETYNAYNRGYNRNRGNGG